MLFKGDVRNDLYLTLNRGDFEKGAKSAGKNVEIRVMVIGESGEVLKVSDECLFRLDGGYSNRTPSV